MREAINPSEKGELLHQFARLLAVAEGELKEVQDNRKPSSMTSVCSADLIVKVLGHTFIVEWKPNGHTASVLTGIQGIRRYAKMYGDKAIPVFAAPYIGEVGRKLCEEVGLSWLDLSGNAHLSAPGLRVQIEGKTNQFKKVGRPKSVFAPKSARIARTLLIAPDHPFTQRELAKRSGMDEGFTSRIVRQLEEQQLVKRGQHGEVKLADYGAMLDAWREVYDFSRNKIIRGHISSRSSEACLTQLAANLRHERIEYAATGLAAAWLINHFSGFRLNVVYVVRIPRAEVRERMGFYEEAQGENVWLVEPKDEGVFQGAEDREGIRCVHPVQAYLDLKGHPERSKEAAEELRMKLMRELHVR